MKKSIFYLFSTLFCISCVLPFDPKLKNDNQKLVIEGQITNQEEIQTVKISYTAAYSEASNFDKIAKGFDVKIVDDLGKKIFFGETTSAGIYKTFKPEKGEIGRTYHLEIITNDGSKIESLPEKLNPVPKINRIFGKFRAINQIKTDKINIIEYPNIYKGVFDIYLESEDSPTPNEFYRWEWEHFEARKYCYVYLQIPDKLLNPPRPEKFAKIPCCNKQPCWDISKCEICPILLSDKFINGNLIANQFIGTVPYYSAAPFFMVIKQYLISENAYKFHKNLKELTSNVGGIFDYSPFKLKGNLFNKTNPNEEIIGFFEASSVAVLSTYLPRNNAPFPPSRPSLPPVEIKKECEPCNNNAYRTNIKPEGWFDSGFYVDEEN